AYGGTLFKLTPAGVVSNLYSFVPEPNSFVEPIGLVQGSDGYLYGTTQIGGTNNYAEDQYGNIVGCGTLFRADTNGTVSTVFSFDGTDGSGPLSPLTLGQ